jgi:beta-aspartyl-peptidase (threonine type)
MTTEKYSLALHGGAGTITKGSLTAVKELAYLEALRAALGEGEKILKEGGSALDAVTSTVISLEDCPLFNAGKGAVFTAEGLHEMDAAVMRGDTLEAGAVAGVQHIRNPVLLAKTIMEKSEHVMLSGKGAEEFALKHGLPAEDLAYFHTEFRYLQLMDAQKDNSIRLDHTRGDEKKFGTVGAVARDRKGNLAAATSTGGMTNKRFMRIGDTPIIGAGTYANNTTCAVSCTGHGEFFIRGVVAYDISCLIEYKGLSLKEACHLVVLEKLVRLGGEGGLIAVDKSGEIVLVFNSEGMYRASVFEGKEPYVGIYE